MQTAGEQIPHQEWPNFFHELTSENKGRPIRIERLAENRREQVEEELPLFGIDYDSHHGEMISISLGVDRLKYEHPIVGPREVKLEQGADGRARAISVTDKNGEEIVITFQA